MKKSIFVVLILMLPLGLWAQTVSVDATNGAPDNTTTFNSLQIAITSFQASGDVTAGTNGGGVGNNHGNVAADIINIISAAPIDEAIFIDAQATAAAGLHVLDEDLVIQGSSVTAIVALKQTGFGTIANDCGLFWRQDVDLTLKDIIFIPSLSNTPADDALYFRSTTNAQDTIVNVENVTVTSNNGSNAPIITTGLEDGAAVEALLDAPGTVGFGDDGIYVVSRLEGGSITMNATKLIISAFNETFTMDPARTGELASDGIMVFMSGAITDIINAFLNLNEGCVISQVPRFGIQNPYGGYLKINGTHANPVILYNCHSDGIWNFSSLAAPTQATICEVNNCIIVNCDGTGIKEQEDAGRGFVKSVTNTIIANCMMPGIELYANGVLPPGVTDTVTIDNVTIHNCGYNPGTDVLYDFRGAAIASPTYSTTYKSNRNVAITDTIITGLGLTGIYNSSTGTYTVDFSSLVTENMTGYAYMLGSQTAGTSLITLGGDVIDKNPRYVTYADADFASTNYMDVDNSGFGGKGTAGSDLAGGADYIGSWSPPVPLSVNGHWALYE